MARIALIGDVMLDRYYHCDSRSNPESSAPAYITSPRTIEHKPGGAGNVAANLKSLGADFELICVVGSDSDSEILRREIGNRGIPYNFVVDSDRLTIVKARLMANKDNRQHSRLDIEERVEIGVNHATEIVDKVKDADMILISDYDKGTISKGLMSRLKRLGKPILAGPKPAHKSFYRDAFLIAANRGETIQMAGVNNEILAAEKLVNHLHVNYLLTKGEEGISYFGLNGEKFDFPASDVDLVDETGAGDSVLATFAHFYSKKMPVQDCVRLANKAGGISVQHPGCYAVSEREILD